MTGLEKSLLVRGRTWAKERGRAYVLYLGEAVRGSCGGDAISFTFANDFIRTPPMPCTVPPVHPTSSHATAGQATATSHAQREETAQEQAAALSLAQGTPLHQVDWPLKHSSVAFQSSGGGQA